MPAVKYKKHKIDHADNKKKRVLCEEKLGFQIIIVNKLVTKLRSKSGKISIYTNLSPFDIENETVAE